MRLVFLCHFLTLVVSSASAAPETSVKPHPIRTQEQWEQVKDRSEQELIQVSPTPAFQAQRGQNLIPNASWNFGIGTANGVFNKDKKTLSVSTFHFQKTQYNMDETAQEFGLSLTSNSLFSLDWGFKKFCCFTSIAGDWGPYYKYGVFGSFDPKDQFGNVIDYQRYFVQASAGLESLFGWRRTWRLEAGARFGYLGSQSYVQLFYAFPD